MADPSDCTRRVQLDTPHSSMHADICFFIRRIIVIIILQAKVRYEEKERTLGTCYSSECPDTSRSFHLQIDLSMFDSIASTLPKAFVGLPVPCQTRLEAQEASTKIGIFLRSRPNSCCLDCRSQCAVLELTRDLAPPSSSKTGQNTTWIAVIRYVFVRDKGPHVWLMTFSKVIAAFRGPRLCLYFSTKAGRYVAATSLKKTNYKIDFLKSPGTH
jgi:hypothetical protein